jgi:hypothetical protein
VAHWSDVGLVFYKGIVETYLCGWTGARSTPRTSVSGCASAAWCELQYVRKGVVNTKVDGPYSCATTSIKNPIEVLDWREVELLIYGEPNNVVLEVYMVSNVVSVGRSNTPSRSRSSYEMRRQF